MRRIAAASWALDGNGCLVGIDCQGSLDGGLIGPDAGMMMENARARRRAQAQDQENEANAEQSSAEYL